MRTGELEDANEDKLTNLESLVLAAVALAALLG
jgi:hypothetical protein